MIRIILFFLLLVCSSAAFAQYEPNISGPQVVCPGDCAVYHFYASNCPPGYTLQYIIPSVVGGRINYIIDPANKTDPSYEICWDCVNGNPESPDGHIKATQYCKDAYGNYHISEYVLDVRFHQMPISLGPPVIEGRTDPVGSPITIEPCNTQPFNLCLYQGEYCIDKYEWTLPPGWTFMQSDHNRACVLVKPDGVHDGTISFQATSKCGLKSVITKLQTHFSQPPINIFVDRVQGCDGTCTLLASASGCNPPYTLSVNPSVTISGGHGTSSDPFVLSNIDCDQKYTITATDDAGHSISYDAYYIDPPNPDGSPTPVTSTVRKGAMLNLHTDVTLGTGAGSPCTTPVTISLDNTAPSYISLEGATIAWYKTDCVEAHHTLDGDDDVYDLSQCTPEPGGNPANLPGGSYLVVIRTADGCEYWEWITIPNCGTHRDDDPPTVTVNPNPGTGLFQLAINHSHDEAIGLQVFNSTGTLVMQRSLGVQQAGILYTNADLSAEQSGTYVLQIAVGTVVLPGVQLIKQ